MNEILYGLGLLCTGAVTWYATRLRERTRKEHAWKKRYDEMYQKLARQIIELHSQKAELQEMHDQFVEDTYEGVQDLKEALGMKE